MDKSLLLKPVRKPLLQVDADFTPGPWTAYDNGSYYEIKVPSERNRQVDIVSPSLCQVFYETGDKIKGNPNVRLMAAAPDLLDALQEIACAAVAVKTPQENETFRAWAFMRVQEAIHLIDSKEIVRPSPEYFRVIAAITAEKEGVV